MNNRNDISFTDPLVMRVTRPSPCSYLHGRVEQRLAADIALQPDSHDDLAKAGFRRVENWVYRPICAHCQACKPLRIPSGNLAAGKLELTKSQRRVIRKNAHITRDLLHNRCFDEHYALFQRYLNSRHGDGQMSDMDKNSYAAMITSSPIDTVLVEYRDNGELYGVILVDIQNDGLSLVYSFFDPAKQHLSPGSFMIMDCAAVAHHMGLPYVYLGYYIAASPKMNYKAKFKSAEILSNGSWIPLADIASP